MTNWSKGQRPGSQSDESQIAATAAPPLNNAAVILETEVLPRLLMLHRLAEGSSMQDTFSQQISRPIVDPADIETFADILVENDLDAARDIITKYRSEGLPDEACILQVLAPAARHLGECWSNDTRNFADVTIGLGCLQLLLRCCFGEPDPPAQGLLPFRGRFLSAPGEQHTLGILIIERMFRRRGWRTVSGQPSSWTALRREIKQTEYDVIALSVSSERHLDGLDREIAMLRQNALNFDMLVILGGSAFAAADRKIDAQRYGADIIATDGQNFIESTEQLIGYHELQTLPV